MSAGFSPGTELESTFTLQEAERAVRWIMSSARDPMKKSQVDSQLDQGLRAARDRNPRLLAALERMTVVMEQEGEAQFGQTIRSQIDGRRHDLPMTVTAIREAYTTADRGDPVPALVFVYAAAGKLAGIIL